MDSFLQEHIFLGWQHGVVEGRWHRWGDVYREGGYSLRDERNDPDD